MQTHKVTSFPIVLLGHDYWQGLLDWIRGPVLARGMISAPDIDLLNVTDDVDEAVSLLADSRDQRDHERHSTQADRGVRRRAELIRGDGAGSASSARPRSGSTPRTSSSPPRSGPRSRGAGTTSSPAAAGSR